MPSRVEGGKRVRGLSKVDDSREPLVSIVTVVRNCKENLQRAIDSVCKQTYKNIEYIIVDGQSTDGTLDIIKRNEDKIDYYLSEPDTGIYNAMNKGITLSTGQYIALLNADDWYREDAVMLAVNELLRTGADYSGADEYMVNESNRIVSLYGIKFFDETAIIAQNPCNHGTMFVSRKAYEVVGLYDENYRIASDFKLQLQLVTSACLKPCIVYEPIHYYSLQGLSTVNREETLNEVRDIIKEFADYLDDAEVDSLVKFMHQQKFDQNIQGNLEKILNKPEVSDRQKEYLICKMMEAGYKGYEKYGKTKTQKRSMMISKWKNTIKYRLRLRRINAEYITNSR